MNGILKTKLNEYFSYNFKNRDFKIWLKDSNLWVSLYSVLRVRGIEMDKKELVELLDGKLVDNIPLDLYGFMDAFRDLLREMQASIGMQESINEKLLSRFYTILINGEGYRKSNTIIYSWSYIAPHFSEIPSDINELFRNCDKISDPIEKACMVHNGINSIYPYGDDSPSLALACFFYILMSAGIPLPSITADDEDYNRLMAAYLDKGSKEINEMFERSVLNRIESVILLGKESMEI